MTEKTRAIYIGPDSIGPNKSFGYGTTGWAAMCYNSWSIVPLWWFEPDGDGDIEYYVLSEELYFPKPDLKVPLITSTFIVNICCRST